ncbi:hypothetical protein G6N76_17955 [Rhizobium daejeonense]|uniref:Transmembrane protein n=2 Tax=Rhizobiaceae TaxID=82115 RepID=A0AAJ1C1J6_9HYPH|nr:MULTISPECIES: hypothetical protein [Rhizobiaceae]PZU82548.1 MAG: hypothetical protein DI528_19265 [Shinella sp.]ATN36177.1 hypothetical protein ACO34A_20520 [Rhizobium sp. ACO-34A]MCM2397767.1 hypothetical protein [Ciceribacter sp. S95]MCM2404286.1 hypothetical protein [Ciceribacter sp. S153]MCO5960076.1 hypothetical protein [Ciceribacter sp. S101]
MVNEDFWKTVRSRERSSQKSGKTGVLNIALLFGTAVIALSLVLTPMLAGKTERKSLAFQPDEYDMLSTGSINRSDNGKRYTIRRSVLQKTPGSVCIVDGYGADGC